MSNIWDEDAVSEYDLVEEAQETEDMAEQHASEPVMVEADEEEIEEIMESSAYTLDQDESNIIYNARIRLEQARLYEMLINHSIFDGVDADPRAVNIVANELKHYIVKRLEILMGLRQPVIRAESSESNLNEVEIDFLKQLAYKGTMGQSAEVESTPKSSAGLRPLGSEPKKKTLKKLAQRSSPAPKPEPVAEEPLPKSPKKRVAKKKTATPIKRQTKITSAGGKRSLTPAEVEALAKEDIEMMKSRKPYHKMTPAEKKAEIDKVNAKHQHKPKPSNPIAPPMDENQLTMKYLTEQQRRSGSGSQVSQFNNILANAIAANKNKE